MITREEAKELLPIIKEFAEGKQIQDKIEGLTDWVDTNEINFVYEGTRIKHRIKPDAKYRPFKTKEECWNEMLKHQPFGWLKSINDESPICVGRVSWVESFEKVMITFSTNELMPFSSYSVFEGYTFADGTPFGVKI